MKSPHDPAHRGVVAAASSSGAPFGFDTTLFPRITHALRLAPRQVFSLSRIRHCALLCGGPCGPLLDALADSLRRLRRPPQRAACRRLAARHPGAARMFCANSSFAVHRCHAHRHRCIPGCLLRCTSRELRPRIDAACSSVFRKSTSRSAAAREQQVIFLRDAVPKPSVLVCLSALCCGRSAPSNPRRHGIPVFECAGSRAPFDRSPRVRRLHPPAFCADTMAPQFTAAFFCRAEREALRSRASAIRCARHWGRRTAICESRSDAHGGTLD